MARFSARGTWDGDTPSSASTQENEETQASASTARGGQRFAPDPEDTIQQSVLKFISRNIIALISIIILIVTIFAVRGVINDRDASLREQEAQILQLKHNKQAREVEEEKVYEEAVQIGTSGVDIKHKREDDEIVEAMMETALSWSGANGYLAARKQIADKYNFPETSQFMSEFMPGELQGVIRKDPTGKVFSAVDSDVSSKFGGFDSMVTDATAGVYSYSARAISRQVDPTGTASVDNVVYMRYRMLDGNPTDVEIYTNPMGVTKSG